MNEEEKKEYEELKSLLYIGTISQYGKRKLIDIINRQQKEIEKRLKEIDSLYKMMSAKDERIEHLTELINKYNDMQYIRKVEEKYISKDKIKEKIKELEEPLKKGQCLTVIQGFVREGNLILLKELLGE